MNWKMLFLCLLNTLLMSIGQILFKIGSKGRNLDSIASILHMVFSPVILLALLIYGGTTVLWLYILNKVDLSFAYPIQALAFPLVLIASSAIFHEQLPINRWLGICIVLVGIYITIH